VCTESDTQFLQMMDHLCNPVVDLVVNTSDPAPLCISLDRLSTIIKGVAGSFLEERDSRRTILANFVVQRLWPLIQVLMVNYGNNESVIERCGRVMKHSMRCIREKFKPIVRPFTELLVRNSRTKLMSTYLYASEWLVTEFYDDSEVSPILKDLFGELSGLGLKAVFESAQENKLDMFPELVEDCYGMFCRYFRFKPLIPSVSPNLNFALEYIYPCFKVQQQDAVFVVFGLIEGIASKIGSLKRGTLDDETAAAVRSYVSPLFMHHLPRLVQAFFCLLAEVPPAYLIEMIISVMSTLQEDCREDLAAALPDGLKSLSLSAIPSEDMRIRIADSIISGGDSLKESLEDLAYRCEQLYMHRREVDDSSEKS